MVDLDQALQIAHETARGRLRTSEERMKRDYYLKIFSWAYEEENFVYILDRPTVKAKAYLLLERARYSEKEAIPLSLSG